MGDIANNAWYSWLSSYPMPTKMEHPGYLPLFGDVMNPPGDDYWRIAAHFRDGAKDFYQDSRHPDGTNNGLLDGSVHWYKHPAETEAVMSISTASDYYILWG